MQKSCFVNFMLAGVSITEFGLKIPSPFTSLTLSNGEISSMTSWTLKCVVGGDDSKSINVAAFEALLYSAAQSASGYANASGIPVSFLFGWLDENGNVSEYLSYQGFTLQYSVSTNGVYMKYEVKGYASASEPATTPVLRIPAICGIVQPSAVLESVAKACKATSYYQLDIDHNDAPTLINHGALTTSFDRYVRGSNNGEDDYDDFPGLLALSKSYSGSRDSAGLSQKVKKLSQVMNNVSSSSISKYLVDSNTDTTPQCASFSYWIDEPTMTQPGVIHYKSNAGLMTAHNGDVLEFGTANTNVFAISGSYDGVAYNISDMNFTQVGFAVDGSGNTIAQSYEVVNSWSSSLASVFQSANIINDINALATQFSGDFTVTIPGSVKNYTIAQPVSLLVMSGNTISPITGVYNIVSVSHEISNQFITTLKVQRLTISNANAVANTQNIYVAGSGKYDNTSYIKTSNIISPYKVDIGEMYPTFEHMAVAQ